MAQLIQNASSETNFPYIEKYFILVKNKPKEVKRDQYYKWESKTKFSQILKQSGFKNNDDKLELVFLGIPGDREYDEKPFRVTFWLHTHFKDEFTRIVDEDYTTYKIALARFNDYKKNGRRTTVVFKPEWEMGLKTTKKPKKVTKK